MAQGNDNIPRMVTVPASEIIQKLRTKDDRINFLKENSKRFFFIILDWYIPTNEPGFDMTFVLKVMKGQKKVRKYLY